MCLSQYLLKSHFPQQQHHWQTPHACSDPNLPYTNLSSHLSGSWASAWMIFFSTLSLCATYKPLQDINLSHHPHSSRVAAPHCSPSHTHTLHMWQSPAHSLSLLFALSNPGHTSDYYTQGSNNVLFLFSWPDNLLNFFEIVPQILCKLN